MIIILKYYIKNVKIVNNRLKTVCFIKINKVKSQRAVKKQNNSNNRSNFKSRIMIKKRNIF
jgi:hypothetical protein